MSDDGLISYWIHLVKEGDEEAAQNLWEEYYLRLIGLARHKLGDSPRRMTDEEDVVASALQSFYQRAQAGRFPQLADRNDLWKILVVITTRKAINQIQHERRAKRGHGRVQGESVFGSLDGGIAGFAGDELTPEFAAHFLEVLDTLVESLDDPRYRQVALKKLEGYTNSEIAEQLGCSISSVERKLRLIRKRLPVDDVVS